MSREPPEPEREPAAQAPAADKPVLVSEELFGRSNELLIRHQSDLYRLRITRAGKLILTK